jgi:UDP-N-acetylmuramoyl-tripeptide--D-alanyl-D-alanine ligase
MSLTEAARAMRTVPPFSNRMDPRTRPDGVVFIFDDAKSPMWTIPAAFRFMRDAQASRRIIVMGTISDYKGRSDKAYVTVAKEALRAADHVVFVGSKASKTRAACHAHANASLHDFYSLPAACEHLNASLKPGDLVLLKGMPDDRLERIFGNGSHVPLARVEAGAQSPPHQARERTHVAAQTWVQVVVGFGNPEDRYRDSPHNVGHAVVDLLAEFFGAQWAAQPEALIAPAHFPGGTVYLVKPRVNVNDTGAALLALRRGLGFAASDCVLLHDDLSLPLGAVRSRLAGNDGGHGGVRSVLGAFTSIDIRRVKIGIGRPAEGQSVAEYVLTPMDSDRRSVMRKAYVEAAHRALTLLTIPEAPHAELLAERARFERLHVDSGSSTASGERAAVS